MMKFEVSHRDGATRARTGRLHTVHGVIETPMFMPVGTAATVKAMTQEQLESLPARIILANTYHLFLRPGHEAVRALGGLHAFMSWPHAILTDSGGFQVMSMKELTKVTEDGVWFRSHLDGSKHFISPEKAIEIQWALGPDIMMTLDECVEYPASHETLSRAVRLTAEWARRAKEHYGRLRESEFASRGDRAAGAAGPPDAVRPSSPELFGIVQGGTDRTLRRESVEQIAGMDFAGYALGGLSVGEAKEALYETVEDAAPLLPEERPRYLMGVGTPADLVECAAQGIDLFDCVLPTRNARNGCVFTSEGKLVVKGARYARDARPIDPECGCWVCRRYSRAYIRHLFASGEMLAATLATAHNLHFYLDTMRKITQAIASGTMKDLVTAVRTHA